MKTIFARQIWCLAGCRIITREELLGVITNHDHNTPHPPGAPTRLELKWKYGLLFSLPDPPTQSVFHWFIISFAFLRNVWRMNRFWKHFLRNYLDLLWRLPRACNILFWTGRKYLENEFCASTYNSAPWVSLTFYHIWTLLLRGWDLHTKGGEHGQFFSIIIFVQLCLSLSRNPRWHYKE